MNKVIIGKKGEQKAKEYLLNKGYKIITTNWRYGKKEIDIIAEKDNEIVFIEVRYKSSFVKGKPEESISPKKQKLLIIAADEYIRLNNILLPARFDVICIVENKYLKHYVRAIFPEF